LRLKKEQELAEAQKA
jgi:hypothetical protein